MIFVFDMVENIVGNREIAGLYQYLARLLKCAAQGHYHKKPQCIQRGFNQGPPIQESYTLPLSHTNMIGNEPFCFGSTVFK